MLETGWIKLHRSILKWEWYDDINTKIVFLHLLLTVSVEDCNWHGIEIKRGSRIISYAKLSKEVGLSVQQVRTSLEHLISTGEITRSTYKSFTVISLKNYDKFQASTQSATNEQQSTNKIPTRCQQQYKKVKESKNTRSSSSDVECRHYTTDNIRKLVSDLGYQWSEQELMDFILFNEERGWKNSPKHAAPKWEKQRQRFEKKGMPAVQDMTQQEIDTLNDYLSVVNRFKEDENDDTIQP